MFIIRHLPNLNCQCTFLSRCVFVSQTYFLSHSVLLKLARFVSLSYILYQRFLSSTYILYQGVLLKIGEVRITNLYSLSMYVCMFIDCNDVTKIMIYIVPNIVSITINVSLNEYVINVLLNEYINHGTITRANGI